MMVVSQSLRALLRFGGQLLVGALLVPLLLMAGVLLTRSEHTPPGLCAPEQQARRDGLVSTAPISWVQTYEDWWMGQILTREPEPSWSCADREETLARVGRTLRLGMTALLLATALAVVLAWREVMDHHPPREGLKTVWMAPTILWAAIFSVLFNLVLLRTEQRLPGLVAWLELHSGVELQALLLPRATEGVRWWSSVLVLTLGGGTLWGLRTGLASDLKALVQKEYVLSAWANGLPPSGRFVRNLLPALLGRMSTRFPQLLGEVIVVEYIFYLDGSGRDLVILAEQRDAPALMTITLVMVALSLGLHGLTQLIAARLHPARQEETA